MELADMVLALDKQQNAPTGRICNRDKDHGRLTALKSAAALMCGSCGYTEPVSLIGNA